MHTPALLLCLLAVLRGLHRGGCDGCTKNVTQNDTVINMCESRSWDMGRAFLNITSYNMGGSVQCNCTLKARTRGGETSTHFRLMGVHPNLTNCQQSFIFVHPFEQAALNQNQQNFTCSSKLGSDSYTGSTAEEVKIVAKRMNTYVDLSYCFFVQPYKFGDKSLELTCQSDLEPSKSLPTTRSSSSTTSSMTTTATPRTTTISTTTRTTASTPTTTPTTTPRTTASTPTTTRTTASTPTTTSRTTTISATTHTTASTPTSTRTTASTPTTTSTTASTPTTTPTTTRTTVSTPTTTPTTASTPTTRTTSMPASRSSSPVSSTTSTTVLTTPQIIEPILIPRPRNEVVILPVTPITTPISTSPMTSSSSTSEDYVTATSTATSTDVITTSQNVPPSSEDTFPMSTVWAVLGGLLAAVTLACTTVIVYVCIRHRNRRSSQTSPQEMTENPLYANLSDVTGGGPDAGYDVIRARNKDYLHPVNAADGTSSRSYLSLF